MSAGFVEPMLPTLVDEAPAGAAWIHEIKYDGYRTQLAIDGPALPAETVSDLWSEVESRVLQDQEKRSIASLSDQLMALRDLPANMFLDEDQPLTGEEQKLCTIAESAGAL